MKRVLGALAALVVASLAGMSHPATAQPAGAQSQRMVESRIVSVLGNQVQLHDGTMMTVPLGVATPSELELGNTVRLTYEVRNGQNVATSIQVVDRPSGVKSP
jgi:hypothetical protein